MDLFLIIIGAILIITGFIGSFLPILPGPPLSYAGLIMLQLTSLAPFSTRFLIVWALIVVVVMVIENIVPAYGTKKFGGSPYGIAGSIAGLLIGIFFFPPAGMIIGPIAGAFAGEMIGGKTSDLAFKAAMGSFAGFLAGTVVKAIAAAIMGYYYFINLH